MNKEKSFFPGPLLLFGSGETLPASGKAYEFLAKKLKSSPSISILETPAGFQLNSKKVAREVGDFLEKRLQNYKPKINILPARRRGGDFSTDDPAILEPMLNANWFFMGPGSPTYAIKHMQNSLAYEYFRALHQHGYIISLASAAVLAISKHTVPVYEIYKVGEDPFWAKGLDFLSEFGLDITFVPHWNNQDGGKDLDTSRCFMGKDRFENLVTKLPKETQVVGIDEQTALLLDFENPEACHVFGKGAVHILNKDQKVDIQNGETFHIKMLGDFQLPSQANAAFEAIWRAADQAKEKSEQPPEDVLVWMQEREKARQGKKWDEADRLRMLIEETGWEVKDTPQGPKLVRKG